MNHADQITNEFNWFTDLVQIVVSLQLLGIDHFARCKQHWSKNTSCFSL